MDSISFFWSFFKMLAALAVVIALMIVAMYFMKKYFFNSLPEASGSGALINIITTRHLSPKNSIMLVEVLGQLVLLGISNQQMSMLSAINDPDAIEKIRIARLKDGLISAADPLLRYKSLFRNFGRLRKDR